MEAERRKKKELTEAAEAMETYKQQVTETGKTFALLEHETNRVFGGFPEFRKLLVHERKWPEPDTAGDEHQLLADAAAWKSRPPATI